MAISITPVCTKECLNGTVELVGAVASTVKVGTDNMSERKWLFIQNASKNPVFIGCNSANGTAMTAYLLAKKGIKLKAGADIWLPVADSINVYARLLNSATVGNGRLRIMEMA